MAKAWTKSYLYQVAGLMGIVLFLFQNCGPAVLTGSSSEVQFSQNTDVGTTVDLTSLLSAPPENSNNVLYPLATNLLTYSYSQGAPLLQNLVLLRNDFNNLFWVHEPSSTVVAQGDVFSKASFTPEAGGDYSVFGMRNGTTYLVTKFSLVARQSPASDLSSPGAVTINQKIVSADAVNESILISLDLPNVDLQTSQITNKSTGQVLADRRAILVNKKLSESVEIEIRLTDTKGQTLTKTLTLPAKTPGPTPTPTPPPTTPTPTPTPPPATPTPTPTTPPPLVQLAKLTNVISGTNLGAGHSYEKLFDGCTSADDACTAWSTDVSDFEVEFDFKAPYALEKVQLFGDTLGTWVSRSYDVLYKNNAADAYTVHASNINAFSNSWNAITTPGLKARYLLIRVHGYPLAFAVQARELEIWGRLAP